ncbi:hypothetical protein [Hymenobacter terricola]|uniref:hypothetical protein n=1 Tax=Hymenobacter terricola TaxID=2819236 RepID=UPI001B306607|nr:hypothetical protein [Hymenobacter terricola]
MSHTTTAPVIKKPAYQRPYKSRNERREVDRRKHDESKERKFLLRMAVGVGLLLLLALGFAIKGLIDHENSIPKSQIPHKEIN